jgi:hypothetical protein
VIVVAQSMGIEAEAAFDAYRELDASARLEAEQDPINGCRMWD